MRFLINVTLTRLNNFQLSVFNCQFELFPFNCRRWFRADVVTYSVNASDFIDDIVRYFCQEFIWEVNPVC